MKCLRSRPTMAGCSGRLPVQIQRTSHPILRCSFQEIESSISTWNLSVMTKVTRSGEGFAATEISGDLRVRAYNGPAIYRDGLLYTFTGPQLLCVDAATGNVKWQERVGAGTLMGMGANLALLGQTSGELRIVRASPAGYEELSRLRVFTREVMSVTGPSFAAGRLFVRNVSEMAAFTVTPAR